MPIALPQPLWPPELIEEGPPEDPTILLSAPVMIGPSPHRILALRMNPKTLSADYRTDLSEDVYAECPVDAMLEEMTFLEDLDQSVLVSLPSGDYVLWMLPFSDTARS